jgi:indolepyruvate ferredoxin oxidoreductase
MKFLRGTALDIFGYTGERQRERQLIGDYEQLVDTILADLDTGKHALAVELAALPEAIKGFGHIKDSNIEEYERSRKTLLGQFRETLECDPVRFINIA